MALAWSQIFVVSANNMATPWGQFAAMGYWDVLEAHALGNFRALLQAVTLSPAMGVSSTCAAAVPRYKAFDTAVLKGLLARA